jgi:hypothetical protein
MAANEEIQGFGNGFPVSEGYLVHDVEECTFRAPRPGFFVCDSPTTSEHNSPLQQRVDDSMSRRVPTPNQPLGRLNALPSELLCEIFLHLDTCSLLSLQQMNQRVKSVIEDWPSFRIMAAFPKLLSAVEALQCRFWTIETLIGSIQDEHCVSCGHFGDLMYLVTAERWCYRCFLKEPLLYCHRSTPENLSHEQADRIRQVLPCVRLVPGSYGWKAQGVLKVPRVAVDERTLRRLLPNERPPDRTIDQGHPLRYTTVIRAPYWNAPNLRFEEGLMCRACASQGGCTGARTPGS